MKTCTHCGREQRGSAGVYRDGKDYPLCHPDHGMDCYRLVTVYKHPLVDCKCNGLRVETRPVVPFDIPPDMLQGD